MPVALEIAALETLGLTLKRKTLGGCRQSPHEKSKDFLQYPCTDSYEEPIFITPPNKFEGATRW